MLHHRYSTVKGRKKTEKLPMCGKAKKRKFPSADSAATAAAAIIANGTPMNVYPCEHGERNGKCHYHIGTHRKMEAPKW